MIDFIQQQWQLILSEFPTFLAVAILIAGGVGWVLKHRYSGTIEGLRATNESLQEQREQQRSQIAALMGERTDLTGVLSQMKQRIEEVSASFAEEIAKRPLPLIGYGPPPDDPPLQDGQQYFRILEPQMTEDQLAVLMYLAEHAPETPWAEILAQDLDLSLVRVEHALDELRSMKMVKRHSNVGKAFTFSLAPGGRSHLVMKGLVK